MNCDLILISNSTLEFTSWLSYIHLHQLGLWTFVSEIWAILVNFNGFKITIVVGVAVNVENWYLSRHEIFLPQKILENMQKKNEQWKC